MAYAPRRGIGSNQLWCGVAHHSTITKQTTDSSHGSQTCEWSCFQMVVVVHSQCSNGCEQLWNACARWSVLVCCVVGKGNTRAKQSVYFDLYRSPEYEYTRTYSCTPRLLNLGFAVLRSSRRRCNCLAACTTWCLQPTKQHLPRSQWAMPRPVPRRRP